MKLLEGAHSDRPSHQRQCQCLRRIVHWVHHYYYRHLHHHHLHHHHHNHHQHPAHHGRVCLGAKRELSWLRQTCLPAPPTLQLHHVIIIIIVSIVIIVIVIVISIIIIIILITNFTNVCLFLHCSCTKSSSLSSPLGLSEKAGDPIY